MKPTTRLIQKTFRPRAATRWALTGALALAALPTAFSQQRFFITEVQVPAGYESVAVYQINDQGFIAGDSMRGSDRVATVWKGGTPQVLGKLSSKSTYSSAFAVNSTGVSAGDGDDGDGRPLGWVLSGGKLVNFYSNNGGNTHPIAISDSGEIGGYFIKGFDSNWRGGMWKIDPKDARKSTLITFPVLPGGDPASAQAVSLAFNKSMQAAGYSSNSDIGQHAVFWKNDAAHTIVDLGVFGSDWTSLAYGLNDLGQVVGVSCPPFGNRPVLWQNDAAHTAVELPLPGNDNYGSARLINNNGMMIGYSGYAEPGTWNVSGSKIVIWQGGVPYDIQSVLAPSSADWTVIAIQGINNRNQMTGFASRNGVMKAVVFNPL